MNKSKQSTDIVDIKIVNGKAIVYTTKKPIINQRNPNLNKLVRTNEQNDEHEEASKMAKESVEESHSDEVFTSYRCTSLPSTYQCVKHPGNIVEAGSLAAQNLPLASYNLNNVLPTNIFAEGLLSDLQGEGVLYACQRHQLILPSGHRAGFFLGDGTGVGKGRQISGIILDNVCRGRTKHIWFSISSDLRHDAQRDLNDIGCYLNVIDGCQQLDKETKAFGLVSDFQEGVLFSTYSTLVSTTTQKGGGGGKSSRLQQLIKWCGGEDFTGCLIFDESHKAKHFIPSKEKASTKVALAVTNIQRMLPKARVVYCSATGVTDVKNMAFMERLGLWGRGTSFHDFEVFLDSLTKRGLGALEMLSMEMKAAGMYVSRGLSYQEAEFQTIEAILSDDQISTYNKAVKIWGEIRRCLSHALQYVSSTTPRIWTQYWACHQRFFKQLCMSMKVPEIVSQATTALKDGKSVVIGLQTTGEASLDAEMDQNDGNVDGFISLTKEILNRFVLQFFPTEIIMPGELPKPHEWCVQAKTLLLSFIEKIKLPNSPLDELIDQLGGPLCVAEMTGRKGFIGRYKKTDRPRYIQRGSAQNATATDSISVKERNAFMNGDKYIAIISDAASTGISLHADSRVGNQRRRVHITAELPWSADKAVQQLGRSHRSNQTSGPIYKLVTSNLGGERRFAAAVARRLQSLGAITKGDRRAATGADLTQFNFDTQYGRQALRTMYEGITRQQLVAGVPYLNIVSPDNVELQLHQFYEMMKSCLVEMDVLELNVVGASVLDKNRNDVGKFLNRILGLEVKRQNLIFNYFCLCLDALTEAAKREGRFNDGVTDIRGNSILMIGQPTIVFKEVQLGASVTKHAVIHVDRGIPYLQALSKFNDNLHSQSSFYISKREQYGKKLYLLAIQKEQSNHLFTIIRPNTGVSPFEEEKSDLFHKYEPITPAEVEQGWTEQYERTKDGCFHGDSCKSRQVCKIGSRISETNLLMGRILSILPVLESVVAKFGHSLNLPREHRNLRVVRMELDSGERVIGLRYPDVLIKEAEKRCAEIKIREKEKTGGEVLRAVVEQESPLVPKARTKALSKRVTIKKYFTKTNTDSANTNADSARVNTSSTEIDGGDNNRNSNKNEAKKGVGTNVISKSQTTSKVTKDIKVATPLNKSLKRTNSDTSTPSVKKRKQSNIFNMMLEQSSKKKTKINKEKQVEIKKKKSCPVCQKVLEELNNEEVNKHVDSCLIE